ncbi:MAG: ATP adenylyltransferase [Synechococcus sp. BS301-5m-G54]|nr:ATP adenylyltransferase [Synechococcus sp. BS301-5m-G54]MBL6795454.1 ATP adenylyltransferase [Synechococcus sp. BS307-5m-G34]
MGTEQIWEQALACSETALAASALVPLPTSVHALAGADGLDFELRHLTGTTPKHLRAAGPRPNPFRPWDQRLAVRSVGEHHTLILNKFPVQIGHMLLITSEWAPQSGWLTERDWQALASVDSDTTGLWFFNSGPDAGASQPHRHLQLLPRHVGQAVCPRDRWYRMRSSPPGRSDGDLLEQSCAVAPMDAAACSGERLSATYRNLCGSLGIGSPEEMDRPLHPYNILLCRDWMALVRRSRDGVHGFSVNALGFAGYLLATESSDRDWLNAVGPEELLRQVARNHP